MPEFNLKDYIEQAPKIELHCHLEGTVSPAILNTLVKKNDPDNPLALSIEACEDLYNFNDFHGFLTAFSKMYEFIKTPKDLAFIASKALNSKKFQSHIYLEFLASPDLLIAKGFSFPEILDELQQVQRNFSNKRCEFALVLDFVRNFGPKHSLSLMNQLSECIDNFRSLVLGISIGGDEINYPASLYAKTFEKARELDLYTSVHAGETMGPQSIWEAIFSLKTNRIGHGLSAIKSNKLMRHLRATQTHLELNPQSNVCTGQISDLSEHPIANYYHAGLSISLNTDDPGFFNTDINKEFLTVANQFGFTRQEIEQILLNTAHSSFQPHFKRLEHAVALRTYFESN